jgi:hypothetical protein
VGLDCRDDGGRLGSQQQRTGQWFTRNGNERVTTSNSNSAEDGAAAAPVPKHDSRGPKWKTPPPPPSVDDIPLHTLAQSFKLQQKTLRDAVFAANKTVRVVDVLPRQEEPAAAPAPAPAPAPAAAQPRTVKRRARVSDEVKRKFRSQVWRVNRCDDCQSAAVRDYSSVQQLFLIYVGWVLNQDIAARPNHLRRGA